MEKKIHQLVVYKDHNTAVYVETSSNYGKLEQRRPIIRKQYPGTFVRIYLDQKKELTLEEMYPLDPSDKFPNVKQMDYYHVVIYKWSQPVKITLCRSKIEAEHEVKRFRKKFLSLFTEKAWHVELISFLRPMVLTDAPERPEWHKPFKGDELIYQLKAYTRKL